MLRKKLGKTPLREDEEEEEATQRGTICGVGLGRWVTGVVMGTWLPTPIVLPGASLHFRC